MLFRVGGILYRGLPATFVRLSFCLRVLKVASMDEQGPQLLPPLQSHSQQPQQQAKV